MFDGTVLDNPGYVSPFPAYTPQQIGMVDMVNGGLIRSNANIGGGFESLGLDQKLGFGLQGLNVLGGLVMGLKQLKLANKQFDFQKQFATTNLTNSVKTYNTQLADRLRARAVMETGSTAGAQAGIDANSLRTSYP